jgi:hypothetical protein
LGTKARATFQQPSKQTKHEARTRHLKAALLRGQNAAKGRHREKHLADGSERKAFKKYYWCFVRSTIEKRICEGVVVGRGRVSHLPSGVLLFPKKEEGGILQGKNRI